MRKSYGKHYVRRDEIKTQRANIKHKVPRAAGQMRARCISKSESTDACSATHKTRRAAAEVPRHLLGKAMKLDMEADDPSRDLPHLLPVLLWPKNSRTRKLPASKKCVDNASQLPPYKLRQYRCRVYHGTSLHRRTLIHRYEREQRCPTPRPNMASRLEGAARSVQRTI